jgi:hypothetical protein
VCGVVTVAGFVVGIALMASNGVQVLIPEPGTDGLEWIADVQDADVWFIAGAAVSCSPASSGPSPSSASTTRSANPAR